MPKFWKIVAPGAFAALAASPLDVLACSDPQAPQSIADDQHMPPAREPGGSNLAGQVAKAREGSDRLVQAMRSTAATLADTAEGQTADELRRRFAGNAAIEMQMHKQSSTRPQGDADADATGSCQPGAQEH